MVQANKICNLFTCGDSRQVKLLMGIILGNKLSHRIMNLKQSLFDKSVFGFDGLYIIPCCTPSKSSISFGFF